jgi:hypothetical protein
MGIRDRLKRKIKKIADNFSGEYSQEAPESTIPYSRSEPDENAKVVMAKLKRPKGGSE